MDNIEYSDILNILPHRYPFLLVDRIIEIEAGTKGVGLKNLTANDFFFNFSGASFGISQMMMIEGLTQTAAVVAGSNNPGKKPQKGFIAGIDRFEFFCDTSPGDQLHLHVKMIRQYGNLYKFAAWVMIKDKEAARGELTFALSE